MNKPNIQSPEIIHAPKQSRFYCDVNGSNEEAQLQYQLDGDQIDFYRTFVPPEARGSKVAYKLVEQGLAWAKEQGFTIKASCWYVDKFLSKERPE